jgi:hypothetical protein
MRSMSRIVALILMGFLCALPLLGAEDKDKKADAKKDDAKKADVKKDDAKKVDAKKDDAKKAAVKKDDAKNPDAVKPAVMKKAELKKLARDPDSATKKMLKSPTVTAKVMAVVESKKSIRLQLTIPYVKVNAGALQNYQNAQLSMLRATSVQALQSAQQQMLQAEAGIYTIATTTKDVEWQATDDVKVRMRNPPVQFDDKGRVKKYTRKELKELKGDDKLPGYPGEFSDIKQDQIVQVTLLRPKDAPRVPGKRGKDAAADLLPENQPHMSLIMILVEPK